MSRSLYSLLLVALPLNADAGGAKVAWKPYDREQARCQQSETQSSFDDEWLHGGLLGTEAGKRPPPQPTARILRTDRELVLSLGEPTGSTPLACPRVDWRRSVIVEVVAPTTTKFSIKSVRRAAKKLIIEIEHEPWCAKGPAPIDIAQTEYVIVPRTRSAIAIESTAGHCKTSP